jgi:hypothetical protein
MYAVSPTRWFWRLSLSLCPKSKLKSTEIPASILKSSATQCASETFVGELNRSPSISEILLYFVRISVVVDGFAYFGIAPLFV